MNDDATDDGSKVVDLIWTKLEQQGANLPGTTLDAERLTYAEMVKRGLARSTEHLFSPKTRRLYQDLVDGFWNRPRKATWYPRGAKPAEVLRVIRRALASSGDNAALVMFDAQAWKFPRATPPRAVVAVVRERLSRRPVLDGPIIPVLNSLEIIAAAERRAGEATESRPRKTSRRAKAA
jgi:hypothetical protein